MLTGLSIRDVVLIDRLDIAFGSGLTVLTGETGTGKSIMLDSLGLALGARADPLLVRTGREQAMVTAAFAPPRHHPAWALAGEHGIEADDELILRRTVARDGRSRAFVNDEPVGVALLRRIGQSLVEQHGQLEQVELTDAATHRDLLDTFDVDEAVIEAVGRNWRARQAAEAAVMRARADLAAARTDEQWLTHAVTELATLDPQPGEEARLTALRQSMQRGERRIAALKSALAELGPRDRRSPGPAAFVRAAARTLDRLVRAPADPTGEAATVADPATQAALAALERAEDAIAEAEALLARLADDAEFDPAALERAEERLFALRAAARKHTVAVDELPQLLGEMRDRLAALEIGSAAVVASEIAAAEARLAYIAASATLAASRRAASERLERLLHRELRPLRLERARFRAVVDELAEPEWGPSGTDAVRFLVATNPGQQPGPLGKILSGGELSRFMLALKVVLAAGSAVDTLLFDEVDAGVGGATAAAVGERLARLGEQVQVLVVTHTAQVAARGTAHLRVTKRMRAGQAQTEIEVLTPAQRREEIARMLAGETITEAARAAADDLLAASA